MNKHINKKESEPRSTLSSLLLEGKTAHFVFRSLHKK
jgi:hypothetical protein